MPKTFSLGSLKVDPIEYASHGNAVLGIRGSGKTYTATYIAERLFEAGIPFVAFDPIGVWRYLRVPGAGKGYPVVVAGGKEGDLPLTVAGAPEMVRAAMANGVSLVLDLYDMSLSKADWRRIVTAAVRVLLHENGEHGLRHVFIEEAAEFIPQKTNDWVTYAEIEKLARMGGNARLGYTLINQRSQEVSKAILELCENVFLHRQRGKNALENMDKWLAVSGAAEQKAIMASMVDLPQGECWAWLGGDDPHPPVRVKVPAKQSYHPDRRATFGDAKVTAKRVDVQAFVWGMQGKLEKIVAEAKANDPAALKKRIAELEREIKSAAPVLDPKRLLEARQEGFRDGLKAIEVVRTAIGQHVDLVESAARHIREALAVPLPEKFQRVDIPHSAAAGRPTPAPAHSPKRPPPPPSRRGAEANGSSEVGTGGLRRILVALAQRPDGLTNRQIGVRAGLSSKSGTFSTYLSKGRSSGWIVDEGDIRRITAEGIAALGDYEPLPAGQELLDHWLRELGDSGAARILRAVASAYPDSLSNAEVGEQADLSPASGTFSTYLSKLRTLELITGKGALRASPELFN